MLEVKAFISPEGSTSSTQMARHGWHLESCVIFETSREPFDIGINFKSNQIYSFPSSYNQFMYNDSILGGFASGPIPRNGAG